ncbi:MAG: hypothetical protein Tsb0020_43590 [Haliangiales bacterium]
MKQKRDLLTLAGARTMLHSIFEDTHSKRIDSLSNYAVGAMTAARAGIRTIGAAYAAVAGI